MSKIWMCDDIAIALDRIVAVSMRPAVDDETSLGEIVYEVWTDNDPNSPFMLFDHTGRDLIIHWADDHCGTSKIKIGDEP